MAAYSLKVSATDAVRSTSKPSTTSVIAAAVLHAFSSLCASTCVYHTHTKKGKASVENCHELQQDLDPSRQHSSQ